MKHAGPELDDLLSAMRDGPVALSSSAEAAAQRERLLPAMRAEVCRTPSRLRRKRVLRRGAVVLGSASAAALLALALVQVRRTREPEASVSPLRVEALGAEALTWIDAAGGRSELPGGAAITAPGELVAPESSWARVSTRRGVRVELAPRTRMRVTAVAAGSQSSGLRLERGEVHCRVPRLSAREQFSIATPDAQVIVHGTVFSVRVGEPQQPRTCVRVTEGQVEVRHAEGSVRLGPGMQFGCQSAEQPAAQALERALGDVVQSPAPARTAARSQSPIPRRAAHGRAQDGTLDQENALLAAALGAERARDRERARALFAELLARHPGSPLAPEARAGLARTR